MRMVLVVDRAWFDDHPDKDCLLTATIRPFLRLRSGHATPAISICNVSSLQFRGNSKGLMC